MSINDVAKAAGVSRGSVSNYLNDHPVSERIKSKIELAIKELDYIPNSAARDLRARGSRFVVFIIPTVWESFFAELTYYMQAALTNQGYKMILCVSNSEFKKEQEFIALAESQMAAGIISISYSQMNEHVSQQMPLVSIEKEPTGKFPMVSSDNYQGGELAAQRLIALDCDQLLYIGGENLSSGAMEKRRSGFTDYCEEHGRQFSEVGLSSFKRYAKVRSELQAAFNEMQDKGELDNLGIFSSTDEYATLAHRILIEMGIVVPEQVQIIGYNGSRTSVEEAPVLTSIRQPVRELCDEAVNQLIKRIDEIKSGSISNNVAREYLPVAIQQGETTQGL